MSIGKLKQNENGEASLSKDAVSVSGGGLIIQTGFSAKGSCHYPQLEQLQISLRTDIIMAGIKCNNNIFGYIGYD